MHLGQGDHDQAWSGCCQDSWIYVLWRVPLLAKEMCDARTIDHSKTLSQEGCPSLSSGAVGLDRSPTHSWSLATSQLCLAPSGVAPQTGRVGCSCWDLCTETWEPHCPFSSTSARPAYQPLPPASALLPLQDCLCSSSYYLFLTKFFPLDATGVEQSAQPHVRC